MGYAAIIYILLNTTFKDFVVPVTDEFIFYPQRILLHATVHLFYKIWSFLCVHIIYIMYYFTEHNGFTFQSTIYTWIFLIIHIYILIYISRNHNLYKFEDFKCRGEFLWRKMYFQLNTEIDKIIIKFTIIFNDSCVYY